MINTIRVCLLMLPLYPAFSTALADEYWSIIPGPVTSNFSNCFFIDQNTGWISGDSGIIIKTTNSGISFKVIHTGISKNIESLIFVNHTTGWATAIVSDPDSSNYPGTMILKTTDGGINWSSYMYPDTNVFLPVIYFKNSANGYLAGYGSRILFTTDSGLNWSDAFTDTSGISYPVLSLKFYDHLIGFACGGFFDLGGAVWKTIDGGRNWIKQVVGSEPFSDLCIIDSDRSVMSGGDFKFGASLSKTTNTGLNWQTEFLGIFGIGVAVDFRTGYEGWISMGFAGKLIYSLDSGSTWTEIYTPDSGKINDIQFIDSLNGWAVGENGAILKYNSMMSVVNNDIEVLSPNKFILFQNYPNPFNPITVIRYSLFENRFVTLKVHDMLGNEVTKLVNEYQKQGNYNIEFDAENLSSGIYYFTLSTELYSVTRKMVVLK